MNRNTCAHQITVAVVGIRLDTHNFISSIYNTAAAATTTWPTAAAEEITPQVTRGQAGKSTQIANLRLKSATTFSLFLPILIHST